MSDAAALAPGSPGVRVTCEQLCTLMRGLQQTLLALPRVEAADQPALQATLQTMTSLQAALTACMQPVAAAVRREIARAHSADPGPRIAVTDSEVPGWSQVQTVGPDNDHGDHDHIDAAVPSSPMVKTPTIPQSAHDVVWCANRGAAPVEHMDIIPKKSLNVQDDWTGLDAIDKDDKHFEVYQSVQKLFEEQKALVKTIKNDSCDVLIDKLKSCVSDNRKFRTSTSVLPPNGKNMRLFGSERQYSAGVVWDRSNMDLSMTWAWPSGYYAKTEFNIDSGTGRLKNGREEALVSLEALLEANRSFTDIHAFNELYADVGCDTLVAVFSRTLRYDHLLHVLALQTALFEILGRWVSAFIIDPVTGVKPFTRRMQRNMIRSFMEEVNPSADAIIMKPFSPVDVVRKAYEGLGGDQVLQFHGSYGCTESCLDLIFANPNIQELMHSVYVGLSYAACANNLVAARLLVTRAGPIAMKHPETLKEKKVYPIAQTATSDQMLPLVGVFVVFTSLHTGGMRKRLKDALDTLKSWLDQSDSLPFRMASWHSMKNENHPDCRMMPFVGGQAITNRTKFYNALRKLENCDTFTHYLIDLSVIVSGLHHPCLRLDLLQFILGLDNRYSATILRETIDLALRCAIAGS
eukprot:GGOE01020909.1.p1 GENE.GGOE01020909.1~~GGOE01020909.1.p1  ORF type:complete len:648 (-),score=214.84 GGOE01020909.1:446-2347(-)